MGYTVYTVVVTHFDNGEIHVSVHDAGDSESDRASIASVLRHAADLMTTGNPISLNKLN